LAKFKTPAGLAVDPALTVPSTKFDPDGMYETRLTLTPTEAAPLLADLKEAALIEATSVHLIRDHVSLRSVAFFHLPPYRVGALVFAPPQSPLS